jgi:formylglycine-generating enzyme required for sulfatase activity
MFAATAMLAALAACQRAQPASGVVVVESVPKDGAEVVIGNQSYGVTPLTLRSLPAGQYYAILNLYGYKRASQVINVPEEGEEYVTVELRPIVGYLSIETEPPGANFYLDGTQFLGTTPIVKASIPVGKHTYEIRHDSFLTVTGEVEIKEEYSYTRVHELSALRGWLQVFSRPSGSQIYLNDVLQEEVTPASYQLAPGVYTVGSYHEGYLSTERNVTIEPNGQHSVDLQMEQGFMPPGMVLVPAGEFIMGVDGGSPDERPRRKVQLPPFYIDKFEVTNGEFKKVFPNYRFDERMTMMPVSNVTWVQASAYAQATGKRLPTEEEWEKAARGVDGREYPWGNTFDPQLCNANAGPRSAPTRVGQFRPGASPYGAMDMAGNVYEWTSSWYQPYAGNELVKDDYGQVFRVLRGGSYMMDRFGARSARRHYDRPDNGRADYGFRCAMDVVLAGSAPSKSPGTR